jgi:hypothetical protein
MMTKGRSVEYSRLMKSFRLSLARRPKSALLFSSSATPAAGCAAVFVSVMLPPSQILQLHTPQVEPGSGRGEEGSAQHQDKDSYVPSFCCW